MDDERRERRERRVAGPEGLRVYHLAQELVAQVDAISRGRVKDRPIHDQLRRAAESVVLNIAEGAAHYAARRKAFHYGVARGSASEWVAALTRLDRRHPSHAVHATRPCANMVCTLLTALIHVQESREAPPPQNPP